MTPAMQPAPARQPGRTGAKQALWIAVRVGVAGGLLYYGLSVSRVSGRPAQP